MLWVKAAYLTSINWPFIPNAFCCFKTSIITTTTYHVYVICACYKKVGRDNKTSEDFECCSNGKVFNTAYSFSCPNWIHDKEILAVKITQKFLILKLADFSIPVIHLMVYINMLYSSDKQNPWSRKAPKLNHIHTAK